MSAFKRFFMNLLLFTIPTDGINPINQEDKKIDANDPNAINALGNIIVDLHRSTAQQKVNVGPLRSTAQMDNVIDPWFKFSPLEKTNQRNAVQKDTNTNPHASKPDQNTNIEPLLNTANSDVNPHESKSEQNMIIKPLPNKANSNVNLRQSKPEQYTIMKPLLSKAVLYTNAMRVAYESRRRPYNEGGPSEVNWSNVVALFPISNEDKSNELVQAIFKTWVTRVGEGAHILLVTDRDDDRKDEEILPPEVKNGIKANVHICRVGTRKEGKRYKIIHSLTHAFQIFGQNKQKQIYLKVDPDSYVITENMLDAMNEIQMETYPTPVEFGKVTCRDICYSTLGKLSS